MADHADDNGAHPPRALALRWHGHLADERRRSPHTVRAYVATAHRFIDFLGRYRGEAIGRFGLLGLSAADLRAFLAERRAEGLGPSSAAREMSAVRAFLTFVAEDIGNVAELPRTRAPKRPRTLPRPASPADAMALAQEAGAGSADWIGARMQTPGTVFVAVGAGHLGDLGQHVAHSGSIGAGVDDEKPLAIEIDPRVFFAHAADQITDFCADLGSSRTA